MSVTSLTRLVAEAEVLAGGKHQCAVLGHKWESRGGRSCPNSDQDGEWCSMPVYQCDSCGAWDYGEPGGPGHTDCMHCSKRAKP